MSGPKIIDVEATRQVERGRIAVLLARLEWAMARHHKAGKRSGLNSSVEVTRLHVFREALANPDTNVFELIALRDQIVPQIDFVKNETSRFKEAAIENVSRARAAMRALDAAISRSMAQTQDVELLCQLKEAKLVSELNKKARVYDELMESMADREQQQDHASIRDWLQSMESGDDQHGTVEELPKQHPQRWRLQVERIRAEMLFLASVAPEEAEEIERSLARVEAEADDERRALLLDDLRYPLAEQLRQLRGKSRREEQAEEWLQALSVHAVHLKVGLEEWRRRLSSNEPIDANEVERAIEAASASAAASEARREVLKSLQSLGYELRSGMETAFVRDGKIVVRKPNDQDYGVELSTLPQGEVNLIRTRVVRLRGHEADSDDERLRDKEREEAWCSDRESMAEHLDALEIKSEVKTARAAGEVAVPVLEGVNSDAGRREVGSKDAGSREARR